MIAIIGKSNSGKTTLLNKLAIHNIKIINADNLIKRLYEKDQRGFKLLVKKFGTTIINDNGLSIDKFKIITLIKNNPDNIKIINDLIHPLIIKYLRNLKHENWVIEISAISSEIADVFNDLFDGVIIMKPNYFIHKFFEFKNKDNIKKIKKILTKENHTNLKNINFKKTLILRRSNKKSIIKALSFIKDVFVSEVGGHKYVT